MSLLMQDPELTLIEDMGQFASDPYGFVLYAFPWGSGELEGYDGPDEWQASILQQMSEDLKRGIITKHEAIQIAVASGHGIGKSALVAWVILWAICTMEDTRGLVTANTETQLKTKTWAELGKWHRLCVAGHWFEYTATALYSKQKSHEKTWRFDMVPWNETKTEAFAGMHNKGKRVVIIFDEASGIPGSIWEVTEGALTDEDTEIIWFAFGNPTRNDGRFFDCFNTKKHRWNHMQIDARNCKMTNKDQIKKWEQDYGEDSDFFRIRVRGEFPNASDRQFIPSNIVHEARGRHLRIDQYNFAPKIICLDNAWTGGDEIVIGMRQGLMSKICATFMKNDDDSVIAGHLARIEDEEKADGVLIDLGFGTGVYSFGKTMGRSWILVGFGNASPDPGFVDMRAYMWAKMKKWLQEGGAIPNDPILAAELTGPEAFTIATGRNAGKIRLQSKEDMKKRGLSSPNRADQFALSFSVPILPKSQQSVMHFAKGSALHRKAGGDYNPLGDNA